jgi:hypothetical protein
MYLRKIVTTLIMKKINENENEDCIASYLWSANKKKKEKKGPSRATVPQVI